MKHIKQISNTCLKVLAVWSMESMDTARAFRIPSLVIENGTAFVAPTRHALQASRQNSPQVWQSSLCAPESRGWKHDDFTEISHRHRIRGTIVVSRMSNRNEKSIEKLQKSWRSRTSEHRKTIENHRISVCFSFFDVSKVSYIAWFSAASCGSCLTWMHATFDESYEFIWILMWKLCAMSDSSIEPLWTVVTLRWFRWLMVELSSSSQAPGRWRTAKQCNPPCIDSEPWAKCWNGAKPCRVSVPGFSEFSELDRTKMELN